MTRTRLPAGAGPHPLPTALSRLFGRYRRRWRFFRFQGGLFLMLFLVAAAVGLAIAADRLLRLGPAPRAVALAAVVATFLGALGRWVVWPLVRRISDRKAAVRLGRHFPPMEEDLVSAVELSASSERSENAVSQSLIVSVLARIAGRAASEVNPRAAVSLRPVLLALAALAIIAPVWGAAWFLRRPSVENALLRLFQPMQAVPYFSYTTISVEPGDLVVRIGDAARVQLTLAGRPVKTALLEARNGSGKVRVTLPCADGRAEWQSSALFEDLTYRVLAGDALSEWYRVRVIPPPALRNKSALLRDPDYAGAREQTVESIQGPLQIVEGTAVILRGEPVARGEDPKFACTGDLVAGAERMALITNRAGLLESPRFVPHASAEYTVVLRDGFGLASRSPDSIFIKVTPDALPQVAITEPARDVLVLPGEQVEVAAEVRDEFGIRGLVLARRKVKGGKAPADARLAAEADAAPTEPGPWQRRMLQPGGPQVHTLSARTALDLATMNLPPGDTVEYVAEASDYAGSELERRGVSRIYRATLISESEHLELLTGRIHDLQMELLRRAAEQRAEAGKVAALAATTKDATVADAAQQAKDREAALARATESLARKFESLVPELARNPSAPADSMLALERLSRAIASVTSGPMASAAQSLSQATEAKPGEQAPPLREAEKSEKEAAERLEDLARAAERLRQDTVLQKLAADAERLAARQRDLKATAATVASKTASRRPEDLEPHEKDALERLTAGEQSVRTGVETLSSDILGAATSLAFTAPADAEAAKEAGEKLLSDKTAERAGELAKLMGRNILFSSLPNHDAIADKLTEVAETLRTATKADQMESAAREIEEFIKQQKAINASTEEGIANAAALAVAQGSHQAALARDVSEQAGALEWLAREIEGFQSATAARLNAAAFEMKAGASELYAAAFPRGLEHGKRALALLEQAGSQFKGESGTMASAAQQQQSLAALLLLQKILIGQKKVNRDTSAADETRSKEAAAFSRLAAELAGRQSTLRADARRLGGMLASYPQAAAPVQMAGDKMGTVRASLAAGDTGKDTRIVQREVVALLESLMKDQAGRMGGASGNMSLAQMRMLAMLQMMREIGTSPGGFAGGTNAPLLPTSVDKTGDEAWRKTHSRFEERLSEGSQEAYPAALRGLLNAYFDHLRKEPLR